MFRASFNYAEYGFGSAVAVILTLLCLVFTLAVFRTTQRNLGEA